MTRKWIKVSDILAVSSKSGDISFIDKIRILCSVVPPKKIKSSTYILRSTDFVVPSIRVAVPEFRRQYISD